MTGEEVATSRKSVAGPFDVVRLGSEAGMAAPANSAIADLIGALETLSRR